MAHLGAQQAWINPQICVRICIWKNSLEGSGHEMLMVGQVVHGVGVLTAACINLQDEDGGLMKLRKLVLKSNCAMLVRLLIGTVADSKGNARVVGCMRMNGRSPRIWVIYKLYRKGDLGLLGTVI
jgi:hypothetical protein